MKNFIKFYVLSTWVFLVFSIVAMTLVHYFATPREFKTVLIFVLSINLLILLIDIFDFQRNKPYK